MMRDVRQVSGLFLALLALVAQLTLAAAVPVSAVSLAEATVLCQHNAQGTPLAPPHQPPDCLLCFVCHGATGPAGLLVTSPMPPMPVAVRVARVAILPPATAPPIGVVLAALPRGPPVQV